jgi:hypothetical protein
VSVPGRRGSVSVPVFFVFSFQIKVWLTQLYQQLHKLNCCELLFLPNTFFSKTRNGERWNWKKIVFHNSLSFPSLSYVWSS